MSANTTQRRHLSVAFWIAIDRFSRRVTRLASRYVHGPGITLSMDPSQRSIDSFGVMQMLDAMPAWSFDPWRAAFTTRAAAASGKTRTAISEDEIDELLDALDRLNPGRIELPLVGLTWDQFDQVKAHLPQGATFTVKDSVL
jgi:hypothetical protein